jgi:hypothetical protein
MPPRPATGSTGSPVEAATDEEAQNLGCGVRFTLTYDGPLHVRGKAPAKQVVREAFHPQLAELWTYEPLVHSRFLLDPSGQKDPDEMFQPGLSVLTTIGAQVYAPLVSRKLKLNAELEVLLLRAGPAGSVLTGQGDIDNRLKVLFDALSVPTPQQALPCTDDLGTAAKPLHTLLEDDDMVTRVDVDTARLLGNHPHGHVRAIVRVDIRPAAHLYANQPFL